MTALLTKTTAPWPQGQASEAFTRCRDGMIAGTGGAATLALWFLLLDVLAGHPLSTPHVLGTALFKGSGGLGPPAPVARSLGMMVACTGLHWLGFVLMGGVASWLLGLAEHNPDLGFGVLLLFVLGEGGVIGGAMMFAEPVLHAWAWPSVLVGHLLAAAVLGGYLWRRHPHMVIYP
jgi:hypothetical protein